MATDPYEEFRRAVEQAESTLDLSRAALAIARPEYPHLDTDAYVARIGALASEVAGHLCEDERDPERSIAALNYVLFRKHGFRGNREEYFDARNSFLNDVIERRVGIPITLSVLYIEVGRRLGLPLCGVGFPGHFLVKYRDSDQEIIIDPFDYGEIKTHDSLERLLCGLYGQRVALTPELLEPATKRQTLRRMLNNLKFIYIKSRELTKALTALDRMMIAEPSQPEDLRERGQIYLALEYYPQAKADFEDYLRLFPDASDAEKIKEYLAELANKGTSIH
jgi:regulator of sirC expression with transglutaminase-like and TPR domain